MTQRFNIFRVEYIIDAGTLEVQVYPQEGKQVPLTLQFAAEGDVWKRFVREVFGRRGGIRLHELVGRECVLFLDQTEGAIIPDLFTIEGPKP